MLYDRSQLEYISDVAKKYSSKQSSMTVREAGAAERAAAEPRFATPKMVEKALAQVMKVHGAALRELAK